MANYAYKPRPSENWDKRARGSIYDGFALDEFETFTPAKENWVRILPPTWENAQHYGMDIYVHYSVGPNNATPLCLFKMRNQKCPVCESHARAEAAGREDAKDLKPTRRVLVWVLNRKEEKKPLLWAMAQTVDQFITGICRDRQTGELFMIDHPDQGFDVTFDKSGEGVQTKYTGFQLSRRPSAVDQKWIDYIIAHPIPTTLMWRTYDEVLALHEGVPPEVAASTQPAVDSTAVAGPPPPQQMEMPPAPPAPAPAPPPVAAAPPPPPKPFVSEWTGTNCTVCGKPHYTISPTEVTCESGHRANFSPAGSVAIPPPQPAAAPAVVPAQTAEPVATRPVSTAPSGGNAQGPAPVASKAAAMRERFQTGKAVKNA